MFFRVIVFFILINYCFIYFLFFNRFIFCCLCALQLVSHKWYWEISRGLYLPIQILWAFKYRHCFYIFCTPRELFTHVVIIYFFYIYYSTGEPAAGYKSGAPPPPSNSLCCQKRQLLLGLYHCLKMGLLQKIMAVDSTVANTGIFDLFPFF